MKQLVQRTVLALAIAGAVNTASAYSLLGPLDTTFQTADIGYDPLGIDSGGPMNYGEGYRWTIHTIYYGFDASFMHYFGAQGSNAIVQAMNILNDLRPFSKMKPDLSEFPTDTMKANYVAASLGIWDLKSSALAAVLEEFGLTSPERYVWCLRDRRPLTTPPGFQYLVIMRNFDAVTGTYSPYVNDVLYTYAIVDPIPIFPSGSYADAVEIPLDPGVDRPFTAVISAADLLLGDQYQALGSGNFFTGLTRDDVAGLRSLYVKSKANSYIENLVPGSTNLLGGGGGGGGSPWGPVSGSNVLVSTALRTGVDKFLFKAAKNDSVYGNFVVFTNTFTDKYYTNNFRVVKQRVDRVMNYPDILFTAADLGLNAGGNPILWTRSLATGGSNYVNNAALNTQLGSGPTAGPGEIDPPVIIAFSKLGPYIFNQSYSFLDQANSAGNGFVWGSFDGTTNLPIVYPVGTTIQDVEQRIFYGP